MDAPTIVLVLVYVLSLATIPALGRARHRGARSVDAWTMVITLAVLAAVGVWRGSVAGAGKGVLACAIILNLSLSLATKGDPVRAFPDDGHPEPEPKYTQKRAAGNVLVLWLVGSVVVVLLARPWFAL